MKPSIGRIVHFVDKGVHYAAIITKVHSDDCVNLYVFPNGDTGDTLERLINTSVVLDDGTIPETYTWHWPEFVS